MKFSFKKLAASMMLVCIPFTLSAGSIEKGGASNMSATGAVGGANANGAAADMESCPQAFGTLAVEEDQYADWWHYYRSNYPKLGSTIPLLRMMVQQSNCFVVVERGRAMNNMMRERELQQSGELRQGSNFGKGQMVSADYTMSPSIQFSEQGTGGLGGAVGGIIGGWGGEIVGAIAGGLKKNEAATTLLLIDNRSSVQISAATGNAQNTDFNIGAGFFGRGGGAGVGAYTNTPEGKVITAAFVDSYNNMVRALRNYRAQTVKGGLGKGGSLQVAD